MQFAILEFQMAAIHHYENKICWTFKNIIVSQYECTRGAYYGLVVVMSPSPQTLLCELDNLKNPERIASIFYM